jgi:hypothetical protein
MGLLDKLGKALDILLEEENENYDKGVEFEKYVHSLFDLKYFSVVHWSRDIDKKHGIRIESDSEPDFTMRYKPTNEMFAIECKFRSNLYQEKLCWATHEQVKHYNAFARGKRIPTFVVIGFQGSPSHPKEMFCVPLSDAKYPELYGSVYKKFSRNPEKRFFWRDGRLS